jgi:hypothetical protein
MRMDTLIIILGPATTTFLIPTKLIFLSLAMPWITSGTLLYELSKEADLAFNHVVICDDTLEPADLSTWSAKEDGRRGAGFVVR